MTYLEQHQPAFAAELIDLAFKAARFDLRLRLDVDGQWIHPDGSVLDFDECEALGLDTRFA